jgi:hypothetical protein
MRGRDQRLLNNIIQVGVMVSNPHLNKPVNHRQVSLQQGVKGVLVAALGPTQKV